MLVGVAVVAIVAAWKKYRNDSYCSEWKVKWLANEWNDQHDQQQRHHQHLATKAR